MIGSGEPVGGIFFLMEVELCVLQVRTDGLFDSWSNRLNLSLVQIFCFQSTSSFCVIKYLV